MIQNPRQAAKNMALNLDADKIRTIFDSLKQGQGLPKGFNWSQNTKSNEGGRICLWPLLWTLLYELSHDKNKNPDDKKIILSNLIKDITNKETSKNIFNMFFEDLSKKGDLRSIIANIDLPSPQGFVTSKYTAGVVLLWMFEDGLETLIENFQKKIDFVYQSDVIQNLKQILKDNDFSHILYDKDKRFIRTHLPEFDAQGDQDLFEFDAQGDQEIHNAAKILDMLKENSLSKSISS